MKEVLEAQKVNIYIIYIKYYQLCHIYFFQAWQKYAESQPVRFSDRDMFPLLIDTVTRVAKFIGKKIEACQELV